MNALYLWTIIFISTQQKLGTSHDGKKTIFQHLHLFNVANLYHFLHATSYISRKLAFLCDQSCGHFYYAITKLAYNENLYCIRSCRKVDEKMVPGPRTHLEDKWIPEKFKLIPEKVKSVWVHLYGSAWVLSSLGSEYWAICTKWHTHESSLLQHWKSK